MSHRPENWQFFIDLVIPHPERPQALLLADAAGWRLPRVRERGAPLELARITRALEGQLGVAALVLRLLDARRDEEQGRSDLTCLLEQRSPRWTPPPGARWVDRAELAGLALADPAQRALVDSCLAEAERGAPPPDRAPWATPGWFDTAEAWIARALGRRGLGLAAPVEQVRNWSISCVLRARTDAGALYFKASARLPLFAPEPSVMALLAQWYPASVPAPLDLDAERRWMLLRDFGPSLRDSGDPAPREAMLRALGEMQRGCATRVAELLGAGCLDRRLERLPGQLDDLLQDDAALAGLDAEEVARFRRLRPRLAALCERLAACPIPQTLVHGDLHLGNVTGQGQIFDWTDACVTHPFFDLLTVYDEPDPATQARLRDAYLEGWASYAPPETLLEAWAAAAPLCDLHQAVSYQHILRGIERAARDDFADDIPEYVRKILRALEPEPAQA